MIAAFVVVKRDIVDGLNGHRYLNELLVRRLDHADRSLYAKRLLQSTATLNVERLSYNKIFSSPNGFKIFKVPIPWAFAFGLDSREFSTPHELRRDSKSRLCRIFPPRYFRGCRRDRW